MMWGTRAALAVCLVAGVMAVPAVTAAEQVRDALSVLIKAREALGGEKRLTSIKSIVAQGQTRQVRGENLVPIVFEINIELPGKYSRRDETPAVESGYSTSGFAGDELIQLPQPVIPVTPQMAVQRKTRVGTLKQDYARLMLGLFAGSTEAFPLTFQRTGIAESPQGKADVIAVAGPNNFKANLLINIETHLPVMISWTPPPAPPARPGVPVTAPLEQRLYFADFRDEGGLMWPHRTRRAAGPNTTEETTFDRFKLNAKIDPKKFEVVK